MRRILITNDDGVHSPGIHALAEALRPLGEVVVVAPLTEASAIGHALTLRRPLRIEAFDAGRYAVDGTPTDCVNIALKILLGGQTPDLVASGINKGYNLGDDVTYSGTVAGALEAALLGIPAIAVSLGRSRCRRAPSSTSTCRPARRAASSRRCRGCAITRRRSPREWTRAAGATTGSTSCSATGTTTRGRTTSPCATATSR
jgi:5'/3'-nucleotidase SurE